MACGFSYKAVRSPLLENTCNPYRGATAVRETDLRQSEDGYYRRNLGFVRTKAGKLSPHKISLGTNKRQAVERFKLIAAIWKRVELEATSHGKKPVWDDLSRRIAKAIGDGQTVFRVERSNSNPHTYSRIVEAVAKSYPEITVLPQDEAAYRGGKSIEQGKRSEVEALEKELLIEADELRKVVLETPENDSKDVDLLGDRTLHQALDDYSKWIAQEKFDKAEEAVNDTGMTRQSMVKQLKTYLVPDRPLRSLNDFASVDQLFGILRKRPITFRYGEPMARKTATNLIGELHGFFDWLHRSSEWDWRKPVDFSDICRKPLDLESDGEHDADDVPVYTKDQLKKLYEYATPLERLLILLAINCAFGADQIGRLRIGEIIEHNGTYYIRRIRKKRKVKGVHRLFAATVEGLKWAIRGREDDKTAHVLLNGNGNPLWRKTKGGNRSKDIPNAWYRLLDRLRLDEEADPDPGRKSFLRYGFNTLRDTSANMIEEIAGPEIASIHLTHKHQTKDSNLRRYSNPRRKKLFKAHRILEARLADVFNVAEAWKERDHQYVTPRQIKRMRELRKQGVPVARIAEEVGVGSTTVYRWTK